MAGLAHGAKKMSYAPCYSLGQASQVQMHFLELILEDESFNNSSSPIIESATLIEQPVATKMATASYAQFLRNRVIARLAKLILQSYSLTLE